MGTQGGHAEANLSLASSMQSIHQSGPDSAFFDCFATDDPGIAQVRSAEEIVKHRTVFMRIAAYLDHIEKRWIAWTMQPDVMDNLIRWLG